MCKYIIGGLETVWSGVGFAELDNYKPSACTYLIGWLTDNPMVNYGLCCLVMAGWDKGYYHRMPVAVGDGRASLYLVDVAEMCWLNHLADIIRILCETKQCCFSPFSRASADFKVRGDAVVEDLQHVIRSAVNRTKSYDRCVKEGLL